MPALRVNNISLNYEVNGGEVDSIALVHGSWVDHHNWDLVVQPLSQSFRVLTYDRRGHSQSERPDGQGNIQEDVEDLAGLIEQLHLGPAHVAGNSYGAIIVLRLAMSRPDLFRSMALHEPPLLGLLMTSEEGRQLHAQTTEGISGVAQQLVNGDSEGGARRFVEEVALGPGAWDRLPPPVQQCFVTNAPTFLDELGDPGGFNIDLASVAKLRVPTFLTRGDQSNPFFLHIARTLANALPHCEEHVFSTAGHVPHFTHPSEYVEAVTAFIKKHQ
jgi:pimeloyl-ACP methyl ester carboxylesterase